MTRRYCGQMLLIAVLVGMFTGKALADTFGTDGNQFTMDFVTISGATNPTSGYGIVNNSYRMGKFEVTNDQWNKFKAAYGTVTGNPSNAYGWGSYFTGTNVPTDRVSWYEAAQFVNWLNTSTGHQAAYRFTGTQGTGDYTLATWSTAEADKGTNLYRHKDAKYYLPTENEWVKAAYWNGTTLQTYSNASSSDLVSGSPDATKWNYGRPPALNEPWAVGSGIKELNGTYDMMGNVWEWMESPYNDPSYGTASNRGLRSGSSDDNCIASSYRSYYQAESQVTDVGFRVASEVPEPLSVVSLSLGGLALLKRRRPGMGS